MAIKSLTDANRRFARFAIKSSGSTIGIGRVDTLPKLRPYQIRMMRLLANSHFGAFGPSAPDNTDLAPLLAGEPLAETRARGLAGYSLTRTMLCRPDQCAVFALKVARAAKTESASSQVQSKLTKVTNLVTQNEVKLGVP